MGEDCQHNKVSLLGKQAHDHLVNDEFEQALMIYGECLEILEVDGDDEKQAMIHNNMGLIRVRTGQYNHAMENFENACRLYNGLDDKEGLANQFQNIGSVYRDIKDYAKAVDMYLKSLSLFEKLDHKLQVADQYGNIAYIHAVSGDVKNAVSWYTLSLNLYENLDETEKAGLARANLKALAAALPDGEGDQTA